MSNGQGLFIYQCQYVFDS